jgi:hypothetical protein
VERCPFKLEKDLRKEGRGSMDSYVSEDGILLVKWYDNKEVIMGTNHYSVEPLSKVRRWDKSKKVYMEINIPDLIRAYNQGMGGVDRCDQLLSFYRWAIVAIKKTYMDIGLQKYFPHSIYQKKFLEFQIFVSYLQIVYGISNFLLSIIFLPFSFTFFFIFSSPFHNFFALRLQMPPPPSTRSLLPPSLTHLLVFAG